MIPLAIDGYLREQDMLQALVEDVVFSPPREVPPYAALHVGVASRGESSKTGRGQGIVFDAPRSLALLRASVQGKSAQDRLFRISSDLYKRWWRAAAKGVCGAQEHLVGPAHSARHTGASRDMAEQYRDFAEIKRRYAGRPTTLSSATRRCMCGRRYRQRHLQRFVPEVESCWHFILVGQNDHVAD